MKPKPLGVYFDVGKGLCLSCQFIVFYASLFSFNPFRELARMRSGDLHFNQSDRNYQDTLHPHDETHLGQCSIEYNRLRVVTYNVYNLPFFPEQLGQLERTCRIPGALFRQLRDADVIIFQELFREGCFSAVSMNRLLKKAGWRFITPVLYEKSWLLMNGGVMIASKWPIVRNDEMQFQHFAFISAEIWSHKGVVYAQIAKGSNHFHIFGTHLQSQEGDVYHKIRLEQAGELQEFVKSRRIPEDEPVIVAGDFNIDAINHHTELAEFLPIVNLQLCQESDAPARVVKASYDTQRNDFVSDPVTSHYDYIGIHRNYKQPVTKCHASVIRLHASEPFTYCQFAWFLPFWVPYDSILCFKGALTKDLSDHYPVVADLAFSGSTAARTTA